MRSRLLADKSAWVHAGAPAAAWLVEAILAGGVCRWSTVDLEVCFSARSSAAAATARCASPTS